MKKPLALFALCFFVATVSVFAQAIDRSRYISIDPFDYKLDEDRERRGAVRRFRSVVRFESRERQFFTFSSLDQNTSLRLNIRRDMTAPSTGQIVTIYFTATRMMLLDTAVLDDIDFDNTTEAGIGLIKSSIPASTNIRRADYTEIEIFDYRSAAELATHGEVRRYSAVVNFLRQDGIMFSFVCPEERNPLFFKVERRFPPLTPQQRVTVFFTATKWDVDSLVLDDIAL